MQRNIMGFVWKSLQKILQTLEKLELVKKGEHVSSIYAYSDVWSNPRLLVLRRADDDLGAFGDMLDEVAGGGGEEGEAPLRTAVRETFEEAGIAVDECDLHFFSKGWSWSIGPHKRFIQLKYREVYRYAVYFAKDHQMIHVKVSREHDENYIRWILVDKESLAELKELPEVFQKNALKGIRQMKPSMVIR
jgi:8-oxo-dGTP pyrophosphatase MutT (NUDIX family)